MDKSCSADFNDTAYSYTEFGHYLKSNFDEVTATRVLTAFHCMGLPAPETREEFLPGTEGCLVFLKDYGLVIRIERTSFQDQISSWITPERVNDSGYIISPIASMQAGKATIEICPGCDIETKSANVDHVFTALRHENIDYWDWRVSNNGRLPVKTPSFPDGVPVVVDRLAVRRLGDGIKLISDALKRMGEEALEAQRTLYAPLKQAWRKAWPNPSNMQEFWSLCRAFVSDGKLIAGWEKAEMSDDKPFRASQTGRKYGLRLS